MTLAFALSVEETQTRQEELASRLASALGIPRPSVHIVRIRPGSVVVEFQVESDPFVDDVDIRESIQRASVTGGVLAEFQPLVDTLTLSRRSSVTFAVGITFYATIFLSIVALLALLAWSQYRQRHPDRFQEASKINVKLEKNSLIIDMAAARHDGESNEGSEDDETRKFVLRPSNTELTLDDIRWTSPKCTAGDIDDFELFGDQQQTTSSVVSPTTVHVGKPPRLRSSGIVSGRASPKRPSSNNCSLRMLSPHSLEQSSTSSGADSDITTPQRRSPCWEFVPQGGDQQEEEEEMTMMSMISKDIGDEQF